MTTLTRRAAIALLVLVLSAVVSPAAAAPPGANDDAYSTNEDTAKVVEAPGLLGNDVASDELEPCVGSVDTSNLKGSLEWAADGSFTYTPPANFHEAGSANSFTYTMYEVAGGEPCQGNPGSTAMVEITVDAVNDAPTASADSFQALKNTTLIIGTPGVLSNDSDVDEGDSLTAVKTTNPAHGIVVWVGDGSFSYTPAANYTGLDTFSYYASDGEATSPTRVVTITVSSIPPINTPTPPPPTTAPTPPIVGETLTPILTPPPVEVTLEPGASPTAFVPPTPQLTGPAGSAVPGPSLAPGETPQPGEASDGAFGSPLTILLGLTLIALIVGIAAAMWAPGWLEARRRREG